jgi:hypothetical protein
MKRKILVLLLISIFAVSSFAQEKKNAVFVDFGSTIIGVMNGGFGIGFGYERALSDNFSVMVSASYIGFTIAGYKYDTEYLGISAGLRARYYPLSNPVGGWYIDIGGGYSYIGITYDEKATSNIFEAGILTGWKFIFRPGFFLEPGIRYTFVFGEINTPSGSASISAVGGFSFWLGLGWAF